MNISPSSILLLLYLSQSDLTTAAPAPASQAAVSKASAVVNPSAAAAQGAAALSTSFETALCINSDIADAFIAPNERWDAVDTRECLLKLHLIVLASLAPRGLRLKKPTLKGTNNPVYLRDRPMGYT